MKLHEKLDYIQTNHMGEWLKTRRETADYVSSQYPMICICGRLATGFHEMNCTRFRNRVKSLTVKKLEHLLPKKAEKKL